MSLPHKPTKEALEHLPKKWLEIYKNCCDATHPNTGVITDALEDLAASLQREAELKEQIEAHGRMVIKVIDGKPYLPLFAFEEEPSHD